MPVPFSTILELFKIGFKPVPLNEDAKTPAMAWTDIYENSWDMGELYKHRDRFSNIATCFGRVRPVIGNPDGNTYYLNCLDIDSENAFDILRDVEHILDSEYRVSIIEQATERTWVTKSRKRYGYHVYWLSLSQNPAVRPDHCKEGYEFEIKTDKSGLISLPPSRHRDYNDWKYENIGKPALIKTEYLYPQIIKAMKPHMILEEKEFKPVAPKKAEGPPKILDESYVSRLVTAAIPMFRPGFRNIAAFGLSGLLFKQNIDYASSEKIFNQLITATGDEEKRARILTLKDAYKKGNKRNLTGYSRLKTIDGGVSVSKILGILGEL